MGIKDLLKNLEGATVQKNIGDFSGKRLAIDASGWLHKAVFATAEDWVDSNCTDSQLYVDFMLTRVRNVQACGVTPIMVFDGKRNNLKSETRAKRDEGRLGNIENAKRLIETISKTTDPGCRNKMRNECIACFQRGLGVTHEMEKNCMAALRKCNVDIIVAPYEADPQLAYLCHIGYCDGVMTEDSDILVYSAVCGTPFPILYKFEKSGSVQITDLTLCGVFASSDSADPELARSDMSSNDLESLCSNGIGVADSSTATSSSSSSKKRKLGKDPLAPAKVGSGADGFLNQLQMYFKPVRSSINNISSDVNGVNIVGRRMFVQLCLLAGCDYSESVPGVGLQTAIQAVVRFKDVPNNLRLKKICDYFKLTGKRVLDTYLPRILRAEQLFFYHPVFNPYSDSIAHFTPPSVSEALEASGPGAGPAETLGPAISEMELYRLGADTAEILALTRKDSPSSSPKSSFCIDPALLSIRSACRGHASIKDGQEISPRYPWEGPSASTQKSGNSSGWFMRRSLMQALGSAPAHSNVKPLSHFRAQSVGYNAASNHSNTGVKSMNSINSFMLANVYTTRPSSSNLLSGSNRFASKSLPGSIGAGSADSDPNSSRTVAPYHLQQQLSQAKMAAKSNYFDSMQLTGATQLSNVNSPGITSRHFQRSVTAPVLASTANPNTSTQEIPASLSSCTDDDTFVYDLCEDSMSEIPDTASPPAKFARKSPLKASPTRNIVRPEDFDVYDVIDSPVAVQIKANTSVVCGQALSVDLTSEDVGSPQMSFQEYLQSHKCDVEGASHSTGQPSKLQMLLSPASSSSSSGSEPTATTKKSQHGAHDDEDFAHSLHSYALGGEHSPEITGDRTASSHATKNVRRKTLGAAPFVPINLNNAGDKRKIGYAAVPIARKKTTKSNATGTGTIMVASIKSFFNAV